MSHYKGISNTNVERLLNEQLEEWPFAQEKYEGLKSVKTKSFTIEGQVITLQFNASRVVSSSAKVDVKSIQERPCFLCTQNRPIEQKKIDEGEFMLLVNPFPIFQQHFTIPTQAHQPQLIQGALESMLELAQSLSNYTLFYNGPKSGASAPDHFHFQAGNKGFMPLEKTEVSKVVGAQRIYENDAEVWAVNDGLRTYFEIQSVTSEAILPLFEMLYSSLLQVTENKEDEVPLNILANYTDNTWRLWIFPRGKHRPWQYFEEGEQHIMLSPASVDMGGALIIPLEKDFLKITEADIKSIYKQVCFPVDQFEASMDLFQQGMATQKAE